MYKKDFSGLLSLNHPHTPNIHIYPMWIFFFIWCLNQISNFLIFPELKSNWKDWEFARNLQLLFLLEEEEEHSMNYILF